MTENFDKMFYTPMGCSLSISIVMMAAVVGEILPENLGGKNF